MLWIVLLLMISGPTMLMNVVDFPSVATISDRVNTVCAEDRRLRRFVIFFASLGSIVLTWQSATASEEVLAERLQGIMQRFEGAQPASKHHMVHSKLKRCHTMPSWATGVSTSFGESNAWNPHGTAGCHSFHNFTRLKASDCLPRAEREKGGPGMDQSGDMHGLNVE